MKKFLSLVFVFVLLAALPVFAANVLEVGPGKTYAHPQDAVNAANPGDTIIVYPGTYYERIFLTPKGPHWGPGDQYAPPLIVWKDNLTIVAADPNPANTIIACNASYNFWVNKAGGIGSGGSIEHSTGGIWNSITNSWDGACVRPKMGTPPNAIAIIASGVTIKGFTITAPAKVGNTAGVMIGGLYAGYGGAGETLGFHGNTVEGCVFNDLWHAVYIWHSQDNMILNNVVGPLNTGHWAGISIYDGGDNAQINLGSLSTGNQIIGNTLANKGIAAGAWAPPIWTDLSGLRIIDNTATQIGITYAHGDIFLAGNVCGLWTANFDGQIVYSPMDLKKQAKAIISPYLNSSDKWLKDRAEKAIEHIDKSLAPNLWESYEDLTKKGKKVFDEEKSAVEELMKILKNKDITTDVQANILKAITALCTADEFLAETAIKEADGLSDDKKVRHEIDEANKKMAEALKAMNKDDYDKAVDLYKQAWEHSQHAMKKILE